MTESEPVIESILPVGSNPRGRPSCPSCGCKTMRWAEPDHYICARCGDEWPADVIDEGADHGV